MFLALLLDTQNADMTDMVVAAGVDAAGDLDLKITHFVLPCRQPPREALRNGNRTRIGKRAVVEAGAGDDIGGKTGVGLCQTNRLQLPIHPPQVAEPYMRQNQVLFVTDPHLVEGEARGDLGDGIHLRGRGVAGNAANGFQGNGDDGIARLLVRVGVARHPAIETAVGLTQGRGRRTRRERRRREIGLDAPDLRFRQLQDTVPDADPFLLDLAREGLHAKTVQEDLDARLMDIVATAVQVVDAQNGFDVAEQIPLGQLIADLLAR